MLAYRLPVPSEQSGQLLAIQPDGVILQPHFQPHGLVGLVENDLSLPGVVLRGRYVVHHIFCHIFNSFRP
jgi:hypothetical protein